MEEVFLEVLVLVFDHVFGVIVALKVVRSLMSVRDAGAPVSSSVEAGSLTIFCSGNEWHAAGVQAVNLFLSVLRSRLFLLALVFPEGYSFRDEAAG